MWLTGELPWQHAKNSTTGTDGSVTARIHDDGNSLVPLPSKICSHLEDYWPIFANVQPKRLKTACRVPPFPHREREKNIVLPAKHTYLCGALLKKKKKKKKSFLNVRRREFASISKMPWHLKIHGYLSISTNERPGGREEGKRTGWRRCGRGLGWLDCAPANYSFYVVGQGRSQRTGVQVTHNYTLTSVCRRWRLSGGPGGARWGGRG